MSAESYPYLALNRGLISRLGLSRIDIARGKLSAAVMTNWMPRVLGSMALRPGLKFIGYPSGQGVARLIPFVFSKTDRALLELTAGALRIWVNDVLLTNPVATSAVTNGTFDSDVTGWIDSDEAGATSAWVTGGYMGLTGTGTTAAIMDQTVTVAGGNIGIEHAIRIVIARGPVILRVGTSTTDDSYINETQLSTGEHHLAFTPAGNFNIRVKSYLKRQVLVSSVVLATGGIPILLYVPWGANAFDTIRYDQSGDVVFVASSLTTPYRIERRGSHSWSTVQYLPEDGPFKVMNVSAITMAPSDLTGNVTLTASAAYFRSTHAPTFGSAGALFRVESSGQNVVATITAQNQFTGTIRVTGTDTQRWITVGIVESGEATFTLQRSVNGDSGPWVDAKQWTATTTEGFNDALDNVIAWYRLGVKTGDYVSGTHTIGLTSQLGSITGICRVTGFVSSTVVNVEVLTPFGSIVASEFWSEGEWSDRRGWPSAVAFHEARLCWAGMGNLWMSATDAFDVFDQEMEGDAAPISRSIGSGPVDGINWLLSLERLLVGADGAEWSVRSSSLDEPLTPTAFQIKQASTQGSADVGALHIDRRGVFVQAGATRVYETAMENDPNATDFGVLDLTQIVPEIGEPSIVRAAVQRQPDTRAHFVRSDGTAAVLVFDKVENTICWVEVTTGYPVADVIEDVCVLPTTGLVANGPEDDVYYVVLRQGNGLSLRSIEKWSRESDCRGGLLNKQADCHVVYDGAATATISGLGHLDGAKVVVWADGVDVGTATSTATSWTQTYTVASGQITLPSAVSKAVVGLPYKAQWQSSKLALAAALGVSLTKRKRVHGLGIVLADTHAQGLFFGRDFTHLDPLPLKRNETLVDPNSVLVDAEDGSLVFPGEWMTDARICLEARAPRPCTACAIVADTESNEQR